jgi:hypothetical protein
VVANDGQEVSLDGVLKGPAEDDDVQDNPYSIDPCHHIYCVHLHIHGSQEYDDSEKIPLDAPYMLSVNSLQLTDWAYVDEGAPYEDGAHYHAEVAHHHKHPVVTLSYAVVHIETVMVKASHTVVARLTMAGKRRPYDETGVAEALLEHSVRRVLLLHDCIQVISHPIVDIICNQTLLLWISLKLFGFLVPHNHPWICDAQSQE